MRDPIRRCFSSVLLPLASAVFVTLACCPTGQIPGLGEGSAKCIVPDLIGQSEAVARQSLTELGLTPVETKQQSDGFQAGFVIRTDPPASTELDPCAGDVVITVSLGAGAEASQPTRTNGRAYSAPRAGGTALGHATASRPAPYDYASLR